MPTATWKKLSDEEKRLATGWFTEDMLTPAEIAERLGRNKCTLTRLLVKMVVSKKQGRPKVLTEPQVDFLVKRLDQLIVKANATYHVTVKMLKKSARVKASERAIKDALHKRNIYFRKLREKPLLTEEDIAERFAFAKKFRKKTRAWWNTHIHAHIDGKHFQVYLNKNERQRAAQHATYGAYRSPGKGLTGGYVKPKKSLQHNTGARSALVMAGVGQGRVLMWYSVPNARWNGAAAETMYKQPLAKALQKTYPGKRTWSVLEDNDPTGFKSGKGKAAKEEAGVQVFPMPRRSPDLNICDYALWKEINKRMRRQELKWHVAERESRVQYLARLRCAAVRLPKAFIQKSIGDMVRRCKRLYEAKGYHFEEGGK
jgi:transposase